jgi:ribonuclease VapC
VIVVDSSAIVAIWKKEPLAEALAIRLAEEPEAERRMSTATFLEAGTVLAGTMPANPREVVRRFERWITGFFIELVSVDEAQIRLAIEARIRFGRGFGHAAKLNFGDCFSYALAKTLRAPLLYTGGDFDHTDVRSALARKRKATR